MSAIIRGGLITLIYPKMLKLHTHNLGESSAVTLMGNDVETLVSRLGDLLIEWWASLLTVGIAMWMLAQQLGAVCIVPIITAVSKSSIVLPIWSINSADLSVSLGLSSAVGKTMINRLKSYQSASQDRINFTTQVITSIKAVKMLGFVERFSDMVREKRRADIRGGRRFRWLVVADNAIGERRHIPIMSVSLLILHCKSKHGNYSDRNHYVRRICHCGEVERR